LIADYPFASFADVLWVSRRTFVAMCCAHAGCGYTNHVVFALLAFGCLVLFVVVVVVAVAVVGDVAVVAVGVVVVVVAAAVVVVVVVVFVCVVRLL